MLAGRRGGGEWGPDSQQQSRSRWGNAFSLAFLSCIFFYIFFFVDSFTQTKTKAGAFSPCLHLGSCFPPAPENVTPS